MASDDSLLLRETEPEIGDFEYRNILDGRTYVTRVTCIGVNIDNHVLGDLEVSIPRGTQTEYTWKPQLSWSQFLGGLFHFEEKKVERLVRQFGVDSIFFADMEKDAAEDYSFDHFVHTIDLQLLKYNRSFQSLEQAQLLLHDAYNHIHKFVEPYREFYQRKYITVGPNS